jgi:hypothetical protein
LSGEPATGIVCSGVMSMDATDMVGASPPALRVHRDASWKPTVIGRYRPRASNLAMVAGFVVAACTVAGDLTVQGGGATWSWRVPVAAAVGFAMSLRAWRRGVIVTTSGIEGRQLWSSWRVPWAAVEDCGIRDPLAGPQPRHGTLAVMLLDGRTRLAPVGRGRRRDPTFDVAIAARPVGDSRAPSDYQNPNWPLVACLGSGIGLLVAMAVADTGRMNQELARRRVVSYDPDEWRALGIEISVADALTVGFGVAAIALVGLAFVYALRRRGSAPPTRWPAGLTYPTIGTHGFDGSPGLVVSGKHIRGSDGQLVAVTSERKVPWTSITVDTYWTALGVSDFSVHHVGARWHLTSWRMPLNAWLEEDPHGGSMMNLYVAGSRIGRLREHNAIGRRPDRYVATDDVHTPIGILTRSGTDWRCTMPNGTPPTTRRLLCVAADWAARRQA